MYFTNVPKLHLKHQSGDESIIKIVEESRLHYGGVARVIIPTLFIMWPSSKYLAPPLNPI